MKIFVVGGFVRDFMMRKTSKDQDFVVVGSTHEEMIGLGFKLIEAQSFPVYHHPLSKHEFALARKEKRTGVGYHGFVVDTQNVSIEEDLERRDFTMNAMAIECDVDAVLEFGVHVPLDKDNNVFIDPYGGHIDIRHQRIRHVNPVAFKEDPVRVLRGCRFAARYSFSIDDHTFALMNEMREAGELDHLTKERIWLEVSKALTEDNYIRFFEYMHWLQLDFVINRIFNYEAMIQNVPTHYNLDIAQKLANILFYETMITEKVIEYKLRDLTAPNHIIDICKNFQYIMGILYNNHKVTNCDIMNIYIRLNAIAHPENLFPYTKLLLSIDPDLLDKWNIILTMVGIVKNVNAKTIDISGLKGKEIGDKIFQERLQVINSFINN